MLIKSLLTDRKYERVFTDIILQDLREHSPIQATIVEIGKPGSIFKDATGRHWQLHNRTDGVYLVAQTIDTPTLTFEQCRNLTLPGFEQVTL